MTSHAEIGPVSQQYSAAATVPLIKSPSLWLPKAIESPNDIHPLPEDITAYFVYPFTLEQHVLSLQPAPHEAIAQRRARAAELLHQREVAEERREKEALHRMAPGYNPTSLLVPTASGNAKAQPTTLTPQPSVRRTAMEDLMMNGSDAEASSGPLDPMDDLVSQLEQMESKR